MSQPPQSEIFKRLFVNGLPTSARMLERSKDLFERATFDDDCVEFHMAFVKYGLDFAFCWSVVHAGGDFVVGEGVYREIVGRTSVEHLFEVRSHDVESCAVPSTPKTK